MAEKQSHKDTIVTWHQAGLVFDRGERVRALDSLLTIQDPSAKILYNVGLIQWLTGKSQSAVQTFKQCLDKDQHMGIAHFQLGLMQYRQQDYRAALASFEKADGCLRGNKFIDYKQLGLQCKLHECEILHNWSLAYASLEEWSWALDLMTDAVSLKAETRHSAMDAGLAALQQRRIPQPFPVAEESIFRPPATKVQNAKGVDYLGKAKVVSELVVPDGENKRAKSPSPIPPSLSLPPQRSLPVPAQSSHAFKPISDTDNRSPSPNRKGPPLRPPPAAPANQKRSSPALAPPERAPPERAPSPRLSPSISPTPQGGPRMKHKDTIVLWHEGVTLFERGQAGTALEQMLQIGEPTAKILFNIGMLQLKLGSVQEAAEVFQMVISKDPHMAIGHYQLGNVQCQLSRPDQALQHYDKCQSCFRGHKFIDYKQLGLPYKLYEFEVLHNQAWAYFMLGQKDECRRLLREAQGTKPETKHDAIDNSLKDAEAGVAFHIMRLPKGALFRPPKSKIENLNKVDFLGQAKVLSSLSAETDRSTSPSRVSPVTTEAFYLPMSPVSPTSPPVHLTKLKDSKPRKTSLPEPVAKPLPQAPAKHPASGSLGGPPARPSVNPPAAGKSSGQGPPAPIPVPARSTSLGHQVPILPAHLLTDDSTIPRRSPPPPPSQNGRSPSDTQGGDRRRKVSPAFDPNQPLPSEPDGAEAAPEDRGGAGWSRASPASPQRRLSPAPPSRPVPPSPKGGSPASGRRISSSGPPERPVPPSPKGGSPASGRRISSSGPPERPVPPSPKSGSPAPGRLTPSSTGPPDRPVPPSPPTSRLSPSIPSRAPPPPPAPPKAPLPPPPPGKGVTAGPPKGVPKKPNGLPPKPVQKKVQKANSQSQPTDSMVAVQSYIGEDEKELSFSRGEIIRECRKVGDGILEGEYGGKRGKFPQSAVQELPRAAPPQ